MNPEEKKAKGKCSPVFLLTSLLNVILTFNTQCCFQESNWQYFLMFNTVVSDIHQQFCLPFLTVFSVFSPLCISAFQSPPHNSDILSSASSSIFFIHFLQAIDPLHQVLLHQVMPDSCGEMFIKCLCGDVTRLFSMFFYLILDVLLQNINVAGDILAMHETLFVLSYQC